MFKIALAVALAATAAAHATPAPETVNEVRVRYADLDVATPAGARALMQRIAMAAAQVCGHGPNSLTRDDRVRFDRCRRDAFGRAVKQLSPSIISAVADYPPRTELADAL